MCGIFGIVTDKEQRLGLILVEAGQRLSYRGYDSVGCATLLDDGTIDLRKDVGKVDEVAARLRLTEMTGRRGIVQLRWATFGAPSQVNAQPHLDSDGDLVGAHNGNVVNNVELRQQFVAEGMTVRSIVEAEGTVPSLAEGEAALSGLVAQGEVIEWAPGLFRSRIAETVRCLRLLRQRLGWQEDLSDAPLLVEDIRVEFHQRRRPRRDAVSVADAIPADVPLVIAYAFQEDSD